MGNNRKIDALISEYGASHQNATNKKVHWICVPLIMFSIVGFLFYIPVPQYFLNNFENVNWASISILTVLFYYLKLSKWMFVFFVPVVILMYFGNLFLIQALKGTLYFYANIGLFALAWAGQFWGHKIEGKKPSFLKDLQFLLIGPAWLLSFILNKYKIPY